MKSHTYLCCQTTHQAVCFQLSYSVPGNKITNIVDNIFFWITKDQEERIWKVWRWQAQNHEAAQGKHGTPQYRTT